MGHAINSPGHKIEKSLGKGHAITVYRDLYGNTSKYEVRWDADSNEGDIIEATRIL